MEQLFADAKAKGMHVVEEGKLDQSYADYDIIVKDAEDLCIVQDPEETPYKSKYDARAKLDALCNRMEANRTIASLEKNRKVIDELDWRIAATRTRLASIAWEVEEPHNAQIELDMAAEFYAPGLVAAINDMSGEVGSTDAASANAMEPPEFRIDNSELCADAMKCINLLGILWAGRDHSKRSFLYLLASKKFYDNHKDMQMSDRVREEMEASLTNNLFYLAQAYGNIGNSRLSSLYCHMTLQRQLNAGLNVASGLEWCKNCMGMGDFHVALTNFDRAAHCLSATSVVLSDLFGDEDSGTRQESLSEDDKEKLVEIKADLNRRWITLDVAVLKTAYERKFSGADSFVDDADADTDTDAADVTGRFHTLEVPTVPLLGRNDILTFDDARAVFLRCVKRLEAAKAQFPLDGFVTDHVHLVRQHSLLYHYLAGFELDVKRKLAMELRRSEMLQTYPTSLSRNAYEGLVKGISHELGEIYLNMFDLKLQKVTQKNQKILESPEKLMKLADLNKCNEYILNAIAMFQNFISFYSKSEAQVERTVFARTSEVINYATFSIEELMKIPLIKPSADMLAEEEVRPYLNAHFFICRLLTKYIPLPGSSPSDRTKYTVAALHRYQWLLASAPEICAMKNTSIEKVFDEELDVCKEMVLLLPPKIDRMHYYGENGM